MDPPPPQDPLGRDLAGKTVLLALADTLEAALELCAGKGARDRAGEIADLCHDAMALARALAKLTRPNSQER